ncbi:MAG TPA: NAD-dependent epimerase/dehydratase family protein [Flavobacteriales bacterium]|nr:NAD-dependent epimerase/dehydratase family protein [Flavobacteriales bacterium]
MHLVTGATGIVGSHVLLECAARGPVRALYRRGSDRSIVERVFRHYRADADVLLTAIEWVEADLLDVDGLWAAMHGVRQVYHTAAVVSFAPRDADLMHRVNVTGTANVVNAALENGIERLCHVSSTAAIGEESPGIARTERSPWSADKRTSAYSRSKYAAEMEVYRGIAEGLDAILVNPCVIIGPGQEGRSSMTLVERLRKGTRFHPPGSNAVVDARDVAQGMLALMEKGATGERFLLVGENITYERLFTLLATAFGNPAPDVPLRPWMLELGWRVEALRSFITGSKPFITRATVHSALTSRSYSAAKAEDLLGQRFRNAEEAISNVAAFVNGQGAY